MKMGVGIPGKEFPAGEENLLNEGVGTGGDETGWGWHPGSEMCNWRVQDLGGRRLRMKRGRRLQQDGPAGEENAGMR